MLKKILRFLPIILLMHSVSVAQISENFSDGNFSENPVWTTNAGDWIVNTTGQLQSNNTVANSSFFITTPGTLALNVQWELYADLAFATSSANYADIYLMSSASDLTAGSTTGYFVRIGNTTDEISLYRKDAGAVSVKIIDGVDGSVNSISSNKVKIKVSRDANNFWILYRDMTGTGNNYFTEGTVTDATFITTAFFGILIKQSTVASFAQKHFFDYIEVKNRVSDVDAPLILSAKVISGNELDVLFNEPIDKASSETAGNYTANNSIGAPVIALQDANDHALVHLTFANNFPGTPNNLLTVNGVKDIAGNSIINQSAPIVFLTLNTIQPYDVVIDEIMAHPISQAGLPNNEWIELKNTFAAAINLSGWKINDGTGSSGAISAFMLQPDSSVIVCSTSSLAAMLPFGKAISVTGFPSLDNAGEQVWLTSSQGKIIHAVNYSDSWYQNELKKKGGWSLEMMDTKNPCAGDNNWKASTDLRGGSPGIKNSTDGINADSNAPKLLRAYATDSLNIVLVFDEPLDAGRAASVNNYSVSDGIGVPDTAIPFSPVPDRVNLVLNQPLLASKIYTITVNGVTDCAGNGISNKNIARVGLSVVADSLDLVINEILFNPPPEGSDYVELYNRSNKIIDLKQTYIANRATNSTVSNIVFISAENYLLFPQDFILLSKDIAWVKSAYISQNPDAFITVDLPSFNDDKGNVIILNTQGNITDQLSYSEKWHFNLLNNPEGVSLERIDYNAATQSPDNWHSAATSVGYGTPGYKNSQYRINDGVQGEVKVLPEIVSPDNDGQDDFATINYNFPEPGYVANITIFDAAGRRVRYLQRNALCGTKGNFTWDGLGQNNQQLATGIYIVFAEVFNLKGKTKQFKLPVVLARRN